MNKKKNGADQLGLKLVALIGALMLLSGCLLLSIFSYPGERETPFNQTATVIVSKNDAVATRLAETRVAATEQFIMTSTAQP